MPKLAWTNPIWSALPYTLSYTINQTIDPTKFSLIRQRSDGVIVSLGEAFTSLADAQASAQADVDQNCLF